jgi:hypothetical protein
MTQVVEHLHSKSKALISNPSTEKKIRENEVRGGRQGESV